MSRLRMLRYDSRELIMLIMKVLIVTGGSNAVDADLDSTEMMESGGVWEMNARLPFPL